MVALLVFFFAQVLSFAQKPIASYQKEVSRTRSDSQKVKIYIDAFDAYNNSDNDSLKVLLMQGLDAFAKTGYTKGRATLLSMMAGIYTEEAQLKAAEHAASESLEIFTKLNNGNGVARCKLTLGHIEGIKGNYDVAINYFLEAFKYFEQVKDTPALINAYVKLGVANDLSGNFEKALSYYHSGLALASNRKMDGDVIFLYNNIGTAHARMEHLDTAKKYFEKALEYSSSKGLERPRVSPLMNIGIIHREKNETSKAIEYYKQAMELAERLNMREEYAQAMYNLGVVEVELNPENTTSFFRSLELAKEVGNKRLQLDILHGMSDWAISNNKYKELVKFMGEAQALKDSLFNMEKAKAIANLQAEYELERTNAQLEELKETEQQNKQIRNLYLSAAIVLCAVLVILFFYLFRSRRLNKELSRRQQELQDANMVKDRLFSIIGHDLKGPIGSIPVLLDIYRSKDTGEEEKQFILDSLEENAKASIDTLDKLLNWGKLQIKGDGVYQTVCDATDIVKAKIRLFKTTADNKQITLVNNVPAETKILTDENQFKFILRNLVSNAIKFTNPGGRVEVAATKHTEGDMIIFSVKDNGVGIPKERQAKIFEPTNTSTTGTANESGTSIGLMLCKEFTRQNGGKIWVESEQGQGATFYFTVKAA
ncbi:MAG TPA: ATP-binding protein [Flavipsychrobacter sp.]